MSWLFVRDAWLQLSRDRAAQILSVLVPVLFFSIFAAIYNSLGSFDTVSRVRLLVVDESNTDRSRAIVSALQSDSSLRVRTVVPKDGPGAPGSPLTRAAAEQIVQRGEHVTITYQVPGVALSVRGKATEGGALGDSIDVVNVQSNRTLRGTITGRGEVSVISMRPRLIASADTSRNNPPFAGDK